MKIYSIHEFSKLIGKTPQTLRNWDSKGILKPHHVGSNGYRYYSHSQLDQVLNKKNKKRINIGYCRVSSNEQEDELKNQIEAMQMYLIAKGHPFEIISDIGNGIDYEKKGLKELIRRISEGEVSKVVLLHEDRLLGFGFQLVEYIAELNECEIEIINRSGDVEQQELVENLVQIVNIFSSKLEDEKASKVDYLVKELLELKSMA